MSEPQKCSRCGAELPPDSPGGNCLKCLLQLGLAPEAKAEPPAQARPDAAPPSEKPGDRIGRYKLLQQIGEGGCGVVYMAEQEEPVRRRVALKVIKLGMDTRSVIARFEAERQALALMDHPNIARILDAGVTEGRARHSSLPRSPVGVRAGVEPSEGGAQRTDAPYLSAGRPFFVMELVRGVKITTYCDQQKLPTRQRLELFIQVCQAVQHAHQKGIIHRDLKPSNILVTERDGAPLPKIIDFGIAKATTDQQLTDKTLFTAFEQFLGTPAYMSPEQAGLGTLDVDTRSDIYSLGVLLYELLTGQPPFDSEKLRRSALDEVLKTVREQEPPRPSVRLTTMTHEELTTVAQHRQIESARFPTLLRGDLDWIVMKCLDKDRRRRYDTANGVAMDIQRHLDCEPVAARPPSKLYEFQKTVRRHKVGFAAVGAVMVSLLVGLAVSTWMFVRERQERARENTAHLEAEAARAKAAASENLYIATLEYNMRRYEDAEITLDRVPPELVQPNLWRNLGWWHGLHDEWPAAAANFAKVIQTSKNAPLPDLTIDYLEYAAVLMEQADTSEYDQFRRMVVAKCLHTANPIVAERISRIGLTLPADAELMNSMDVLYGEMKKDHDSLNAMFRAWGDVGLALIDYRRTNFEQAIEWCNNSLKEPYYYLPQKSMAHALLALAHHALGHAAIARAELAESRQSIEDFDYSDAGDSLSLMDEVFADILLREASRQIGEADAEASGRASRLYTLGRQYDKGDFVDKDTANARALFMKAAEKGNHRAQFELIRIYKTGDGVPKDDAEALKWQRILAESRDPFAINDVAWRLATSPIAALRDGKSAIALAEDAVALTHRTNAQYLDTLAAAYAEAGDFEKAVAVEKESINLLTDKKKIDDYTTRLKLYQANTPYHGS